MRSIKKYGLGGVAVSVVLVAALALLLGTSQLAQAAAPTTVEVTVNTDDDFDGKPDVDSNKAVIIITEINKPTSASGARTVLVTVDIDAGEDEYTDETIVTISTTAGVFANGTNSTIQQCLKDGETYSGRTGSDLCNTVQAYLTLPVGTPAGTIVVTATTLNNKSGAAVFVVKAASASTTVTPATSLSLSSGADSISGASNSPTSIAKITVQPKDKDGDKTSFSGVLVLTTDLGRFSNARVLAVKAVNAEPDAKPPVTAVAVGDVVKAACVDDRGKSMVMVSSTGGSGASSAYLCAKATDLGTATVTARDSGNTLTAGSVGVVMSGALANIVVTLGGDLGIGRDVVVTATATATDSAGRPAADGYAITFVAGPTSVCEDTQAANTTDALDNGAASTLVIAVGQPGNCIVRASGGGKVGVVAEVVEATAAAPAPAPAPAGFMGELPTSGFASVTFTGSVEDLKAALATACPSGAPVYGSVVVDGAGSLVQYFPTAALSAPNAAFEAAFAGGLSGTPLIVGNCGS